MPCTVFAVSQKIFTDDNGYEYKYNHFFLIRRKVTLKVRYIICLSIQQKLRIKSKPNSIMYIVNKK